MGLGRNGERVANTPMRLFPPSRGGFTMGDHPARCTSENPHISQICENSARPRNAFASRYSGSNTITDFCSGTRPLWRGMPNFVVKSLRMRAMTRSGGNWFISSLSCNLESAMHIFILKQRKLQDKPQGKECFAISPRHMPGRGSDSLPLQFQTKNHPLGGFLFGAGNGSRTYIAFFHIIFIT